MAVWGGLTNSCEKNRSEKQRRKGKIQTSECRVQRIARRDKKAFFSDHCKETEKKKQNGKDQGSLQENQRYQRNISCKDELDK